VSIEAFRPLGPIERFDEGVVCVRAPLWWRPKCDYAAL